MSTSKSNMLKKAGALLIVLFFIGSSMVSAVGTQLTYDVEIDERNDDLLLTNQKKQSFSTEVDKTESDDHNDGSLWNWMFQRISDLFTGFGDNPVIDFIRDMFTFTSVDSSADDYENTDIDKDDMLQDVDEVVREDVEEQDLERDTPVFFGATWWDSGWQFRKEIVIDHTQVSSDLVNFPVLINITDLDLALHAQSDFDDIVFTGYDVVQLDHEIEFYDNTSGKLIAWVNVSNLSSMEDTVLYMYYGNPSAVNQENPEGVWDSDFLAVHHLAETSGTHFDSTSNNYDGIASTGVDQDVVGMVEAL